jgi:hypothetical protein
VGHAARVCVAVAMLLLLLLLSHYESYVVRQVLHVLQWHSAHSTAYAAFLGLSLSCGHPCCKCLVLLLWWFISAGGCGANLPRGHSVVSCVCSSVFCLLAFKLRM